jgi:cytochrome c-type biogenesis protein CcmF
MTPGTLTIWVQAGLCVTAFVAAVRWARGRKDSETTFRWAYHGMTAAVGFASFLLMLAILTRDFRYAYVVDYTSRDLPLLYLVSAFWGGQEGTYLLWALMGTLIGYPLFRKNAWEPAAVMACYVPTIGFMVALMLDPGGNPFRLAGTVPEDGRGLNPLLQDPWMAAHPPMVFLGYAALTVPAALALAALFKRQEDRWVGAALRWSLVGFLTLGTGIVLGGFWAYKVLGWGGYWGWDPVENASLVPWIVVTALIHGILVQRATGSLRRVNLVLAFAGYLLVLYATFLTRSGVLADFSVHSFPAGTVYCKLVSILVLVVGVSVFALLRCRGSEGKPIRIQLDWSFLLPVAMGLLAISAAFVLIGTSWPIVSSWFGRPATPAIPYYNRVSLPVYVGVLGVLALAPFLSWVPRPPREWAWKVAVSVAAGLAATVTAAVLGGRGAGVLLLFFVAVAALVSNLARLAEALRAGLLHAGAALAHAGFALMLVGVVASAAWGAGRQVRLPIGQPVEALGRILTYRGHVERSEPQDRWRVAVLGPRQAETTLLATMYAVQGRDSDRNSVLRKAAILRGVAGDLYVAPLGLETSEGTRDLELIRGWPTSYRDAVLTFLRFGVDGSMDEHVMAARADVRIERDGSEETVSLSLELVEGKSQGRPVSPASLPGLTLTLRGMSVERGLIRVSAQEGDGEASETLVVEASTKPLIGLLWSGTILLGLGCGIAWARQLHEARAQALRCGAHRSWRVVPWRHSRSGAR